MYSVYIILGLALIGTVAALPLDTHFCRPDYPVTYTKFYPCIFDYDLVRQETRDPRSNIVFKCRAVPANITVTLTYSIQYANANTNLSFSVSSWTNINSVLESNIEPNDPVDEEIMEIYGNWTVLNATGRAAYATQCINYPDCLIADTTSPRVYSNSTVATLPYISTISTFIHDETAAALPLQDQFGDAAFQAYCQAFYVSLSIV